MRPRVFPAEDANCRLVRVAALAPGFNEAAGLPRGRQRLNVESDVGEAASMRPRVFPAEDIETAGTKAIRQMASMRPRVFPAEDAGKARCNRFR